MIAVLNESGAVDAWLVDRLEQRDLKVLGFVSVAPRGRTEDDRERPPTAEEIDAAAPSRKAGLRALNPRWVLLAGGVPLLAYRTDRSITQVRGRAFQTVYGADNPVFYAIWNPEAVRRNEQWLDTFDADLDRLAEMVTSASPWTWAQLDTCTWCGIDCIEQGEVRFDAMGLMYCVPCHRQVVA